MKSTQPNDAMPALNALVSSTEEYNCEHVTHAFSLGDVEYEPDSQLVHTVDESAAMCTENFPSEQTVQWPRPVDDLNLPASHGKHSSVEACILYFPTGHISHTVAPLMCLCANPASHSHASTDDDPMADTVFATGHAVHSWSP